MGIFSHESNGEKRNRDTAIGKSAGKRAYDQAAQGGLRCCCWMVPGTIRLLLKFLFGPRIECQVFRWQLSTIAWKPLTHAGVVKQVNVDREASRFCPNLQPHAHFFCSECEEVFDIDLKSRASATTPWQLPKGSEVEQLEVTMKGKCPACQEKSSDN